MLICRLHELSLGIGQKYKTVCGVIQYYVVDYTREDNEIIAKKEMFNRILDVYYECIEDYDSHVAEIKNREEDSKVVRKANANKNKENLAFEITLTINKLEKEYDKVCELILAKEKEIDACTSQYRESITKECLSFSDKTLKEKEYDKKNSIA